MLHLKTHLVQSFNNRVGIKAERSINRSKIDKWKKQMPSLNKAQVLLNHFYDHYLNITNPWRNPWTQALKKTTARVYMMY